MPSQVEPYLIATPLVTVVFALYGTVMRFGPIGYFACAVVGFVWSILGGFVAAQLSHGAPTAMLSANATVFGCIIGSGMLAGSFLYALVAGSVLREPSATYAVLSAMIRPTVPFYITVNTTIEMFLLPLIIFLNWNTEPARRWIVVAAAVTYAVQRIWTYLVYAERRLATGTSPLSEADVDWYRRTLAFDYRVILNTIVFALFTTAAFLSASSR